MSSDYGRLRLRGSLIALVSMAGALPAAAQPAKSAGGCRFQNEQQVFLDRVATLRVSPHGYQPVSPHDRACNQVASWTDATFGSGNYILEAGFGQGEMIAATYSVPAADWPIRIKLTEVLLATSNSSVVTTTRYSILFYQGTPTSGSLVETFSSTGEPGDLPHAILPIGTTGLNIQFSVDPQDPEQVVLHDNGSHQFTFAFRIDQHHNQTGNPCLTSPPTASNAFPVVDTSGVASLTNNWLYGLNCSLGPTFNCPPMNFPPPFGNGPPAAWGTFASLNTDPKFGCRPSGDWVMRATWSSLNCVAGVGACCLPSGSCESLLPADCNTQGGQFLGEGISCVGANCVAPSGACCHPGGCLILTQANCGSISNSSWLGGGSACAAGGVCPTGACCLPLGQCLAAVTASQCSAQGGTFRGVGTNCANPCPLPTGACCLSSGTCLPAILEASCLQIQGASWAGPLTTCGTGTCAPSCYANCDQSTAAPLLTANDFLCFVNKYAAGNAYANCDQSTATPQLTANDFTCFVNRYATGCP